MKSLKNLKLSRKRYAACADEKYMRMALSLAKRGEGLTNPNPAVGAVIVKNGKIVGKGYHKRCGLPHAEINALDEAGHKARGATLYVTLEPCVMCAGAMIHARIDRLVYAAADPKAGAAGSVLSVVNHPQLNHRMQVEQGILSEEAAELLRSFFRERRES